MLHQCVDWQKLKEINKKERLKKKQENKLKREGKRKRNKRNDKRKKQRNYKRKSWSRKQKKENIPAANLPNNFSINFSEITHSCNDPFGLS